MKNRVFDCFIFFNELELLELRFRELFDSVDFFVLCEAPYTFRGDPKPLYFKDNRSHFKRFLDKVIHVIVEDMPVPQTRVPDARLSERGDEIWNMEFFQRNAIRRGLVDMAGSDIVIVSDCDEIVSRDTISRLKESDGYFLLDFAMYQFFVNMEESPAGWNKVFAYSHKLSDAISDYNQIRRNPRKFYDQYTGNKRILEHAGWHFTFLGGYERIRSKLASYSHTDGWQRMMWDDNLLRQQMLELRDVGGGKTLKYHSIDSSFPIEIQSNQHKYSSLGFIKKAEERISELELLWQRSASLELQNRSQREALIQNEVEIAALRKRLLTISSTESRSADAYSNLIRSSKDFGVGWHAGVQSNPATVAKTHDIPALYLDNLLVWHQRDKPLLTPDNNCGYYTIYGIDPERTYTASCWIWIPEGFSGSSVHLSVGEWPVIDSRLAVLSATSQWQRIFTTASSPQSANLCHIVLRVNSDVTCNLFSTCWQIEEMSFATSYKATALIGAA
jgi:hypothetical protein